jgi:hypothetical protein
MKHGPMWVLGAALLVLTSVGLAEGLRTGETGMGLLGFTSAFLIVPAALGGLLFGRRDRWHAWIPIFMLGSGLILAVGAVLPRLAASSPLYGKLTSAPGAQRAPAAPFPYVTVRLAHGVEYHVPRTWSVFSSGEVRTLDAYAAALLDARSLEFGGELGFAANLFDEAGKTRALTNVRFYSDVDIRQDEVAAAGTDEIAALDAYFRSLLETSVAAGGYELLAWHGTERFTINGLTVLVSNYDRSDDVEASYTVNLVRVLDEERSFTVTISHASSRAETFGPVVNHMIHSIRRVAHR